MFISICHGSEMADTCCQVRVLALTIVTSFCTFVRYDDVLHGVQYLPLMCGFLLHLAYFPGHFRLDHVLQRLPNDNFTVVGSGVF